MAAADEQLLIDRWIDTTADTQPEVRVRHYGTEVWALVGYARGVDGDAAPVAAAYHLPVDAVRAALAYYHRHPVQVDAKLAANALAHAG